MNHPRVAADARRLVYRVLAHAFLEPRRERLLTLATAAPAVRRRTEPLRDLPFSPLWAGLIMRLEGLSEEDVPRLAEEHATLFLSGARGRSCPPHESAFAPRRELDAGAVAVRVELAYGAVGLRARPDETPDHIATELEFMSVLCHRQGMADRAEASTWLRRQLGFVDGHLARWVPRFAQALREVGPESLYREVADVTAAFVEDDRRLLRATAEGGLPASSAGYG